MDTPPFTELGLPEPLLAAVLEMGFESPSPIQAKTIPLALEGKDLIGLSQTGSGKTAAFALPTLARIDPHLAEPQALIVCPTRELAVQVCEEVFRLGNKMKGLRALPVYGGTPIDRQLRGLRKGAHIVVGTPGRLLDHLKRRSFNPQNIKTVILDEADRMLDMGFQDEMEELLGALPKERQTMFFSADDEPPREPPHRELWDEARAHRDRAQVLSRSMRSTNLATKSVSVRRWKFSPVFLISTHLASRLFFVIRSAS